MNNEIFTEIVLALITILGGICTAYVVPWLKSKISVTEMDKLMKCISMAVRCAEQLYTDEEWEKKKEYVMEYIRTLIGNTIKVDLTYDQLDTIVEGIVNEIKKGKGTIYVN